MYKKIRKKILYAPLFTGIILLGVNVAQSQEVPVDFKSKIIELEKRISGLEQLKQELQDLKRSLKEKEKKLLLRKQNLTPPLNR